MFAFWQIYFLRLIKVIAQGLTRHVTINRFFCACMVPPSEIIASPLALSWRTLSHRTAPAYCMRMLTDGGFIAYAWITSIDNKLYGRPPQYAPTPLQVDLWPFNLESSVRVTCDVAYLCANLSLPRPLCFRSRPDVCDRQTDVCPMGRRHNNRPHRLCRSRPNISPAIHTDHETFLNENYFSWNEKHALASLGLECEIADYYEYLLRI